MTEKITGKKRKIDDVVEEVEDEGEEYEVETILLSHVSKKGRKYYVKWKHYSIESSTWEPLENLQNIPELIQEFEKEYKPKIDPAFLKGDLPPLICRGLCEERVEKGRKEYLTKWKHFPVKTWEPEDALPLRALKKFKKQQKEAKKEPESPIIDSVEGNMQEEEVTSKPKDQEEEEIVSESPVHVEENHVEEKVFEIEDETEHAKSKNSEMPVSHLTENIDELVATYPKRKITRIKKHNNVIYALVSFEGKQQDVVVKMEYARQIMPQEVIEYLLSKLCFKSEMNIK